MGGWKDGTTSESLISLSTPKDPCSLQKTKSRCKATVGCAYCSSNNNRSQMCYNAKNSLPSECSTGASNIEFYKGVVCTSDWLAKQSCKFHSCSACLAHPWPSHPNVTQRCLVDKETLFFCLFLLHTIYFIFFVVVHQWKRRKMHPF
jgi:hypothetical protein